jgi:hypothetical protein
MSAFTELEGTLRDLCEAHGFTAITLGISTGLTRGQFTATLHYPNPIDGLGCSSGQGETVPQAINDANLHALKNRSDVTLVREAA